MTDKAPNIFKSLSSAVKENVFPHNSFEVYHIDFKNFSQHLELFHICFKRQINPTFCDHYRNLNGKFPGPSEKDFQEFKNELIDYLPFSLVIFSNNFKLLKDQRHAFLKNDGDVLSFILERFSTLDLHINSVFEFNFKDQKVNSKVSNYVFSQGNFFNQVSYFLCRSKETGNYCFPDTIRNMDEIAEFSISMHGSNQIVLHLFNSGGDLLISNSFILSLAELEYGFNNFLEKSVYKFLLPFILDIKKYQEIIHIRGFTKEYIEYFNENLKDVVEMIEY